MQSYKKYSKDTIDPAYLFGGLILSRGETAGKRERELPLDHAERVNPLWEIAWPKEWKLLAWGRLHGCVIEDIVVMNDYCDLHSNRFVVIDATVPQSRIHSTWLTHFECYHSMWQTELSRTILKRHLLHAGSTVRIGLLELLVSNADRTNDLYQTQRHV